METENKTLMETIEPAAEEIRALDKEITELNGRLEDVKSRRETLSNDLVKVLEAEGIQTSIGLPDGRQVALNTEIYPKVLDMDGLVTWAEENNVTLPVRQYNAKTLQAWYKDQVENGSSIPSEDLISKHIKTRIKKMRR